MESDPRKPRSARLHDYWLGGKDNFASDRAAGMDALSVYPDIASSARATRGFLIRAVTYLAAEAGVRQFLDIGSGMPVADGGNTHDAALAVSRDCRVVYVDNDPEVGGHTLATLRGAGGVTGYAEADVRDPDEVISAAARTLDFTQPVAVMFIAILHFVSNRQDPHGIVRRVMDAVPEGSYLMLCHPAIDQHVAAPEAMTRLNRAMEQKRTLRDHYTVSRFFAGLELLPPGLVRPSQWRPGSDEEAARPSAAWVGVARKPAKR